MYESYSIEVQRRDINDREFEVYMYDMCYDIKYLQFVGDALYHSDGDFSFDENGGDTPMTLSCLEAVTQIINGEYTEDVEILATVTKSISKYGDTVYVLRTDGVFYINDVSGGDFELLKANIYSDIDMVTALYNEEYDEDAEIQASFTVVFGHGCITVYFITNEGIFYIQNNNTIDNIEPDFTVKKATLQQNIVVIEQLYHGEYTEDHTKLEMGDKLYMNDGQCTKKYIVTFDTERDIVFINMDTGNSFCYPRNKFTTLEQLEFEYNKYRFILVKRGEQDE